MKNNAVNVERLPIFCFIYLFYFLVGSWHSNKRMLVTNPKPTRYLLVDVLVGITEQQHFFLSRLLMYTF